MKVRYQQHWDTLHVRPPPFCMLTKVRPFQLHDAKWPWTPNCELQSPSTKLAHHVQTEMHPKALFIIQFIAPTPRWCGVIVWSKFYFHLSPSPLQHLSQNFCPSCLFALHTSHCAPNYTLIYNSPESAMTHGILGLSFLSVSCSSIFVTISIPSNTWPNTTCFLSNHGVCKHNR